MEDRLETYESTFLFRPICEQACFNQAADLAERCQSRRTYDDNSHPAADVELDTRSSFLLSEPGLIQTLGKCVLGPRINVEHQELVEARLGRINFPEDWW